MSNRQSDDGLGRAIEEQWLGQNGILTGRSAANAFGYSEWCRRSHSGSTDVQTGSEGGGGSMLGLVALGLAIWAGVSSGSFLVGLFAFGGLGVAFGALRWFFSWFGRALIAVLKVAFALVFWVLLFSGIAAALGVA